MTGSTGVVHGPGVHIMYTSVSNMSGESSNCSKILEIVNFFLKFPRVSKIVFDENSQKNSGIM